MINFNLNKSRNYSEVQAQILDLIKAYLPTGSWVENYGYVDGILNFSLFIDTKSDVLMSHGAADKNYLFKSNNTVPKIRLNHYLDRKHLLVPGNWLRNRIVNSRHLNFDEASVHVVGWPRLDKLISDYRSIKMPASHRKRVLWAPTHDKARRGDKLVSLSSYPEFAPYLDQLSRYYEVSQSLHPRNRIKKKPTSNLLLQADVVITDFGTMVYEATALVKQVIFPNWIIGDRICTHLKYSAEHQIFAKKLGLHATSFGDMCELIETKKNLNATSQSFFNEYLPPWTYGISSKLVADKLLEISGQS